MSRERPFRKIEKLILQTTYNSRRPMSIREIAEKADISWVTCRKYIKDLLSKKYLLKDKATKRERIVFNFDILKEA